MEILFSLSSRRKSHRRRDIPWVCQERWCLGNLRGLNPPIMENQMEKKMENKIETVFTGIFKVSRTVIDWVAVSSVT